MKTFLIIFLCFIATALIADSSKHNFTFTIIINEMTLEEAGEFEDELQELLERYGEKASHKIQMGSIPILKVNGSMRYWHPFEGRWNNIQLPLEKSFLTIDNESYDSDLINKLKVK